MPVTQLDVPETDSVDPSNPRGRAEGADDTAVTNTAATNTVATDAAEADAPHRRRRLGRRGIVVLVGALVLLLAGAGFGAYALFFADRSTSTTQYRTMTVSKETLKSTVSATGTLNPAKESELSFSSSGEVTSVKVEVGDKVSKGDVLARIDDDELQIDYDAATAELAEAQDSLDELEDDDDATDTAISSAEAAVKVKENAVKQADSALDAATLVAPFSGTVAAVGIEKGDTVGSSSGSSSSSSTSGGSSSGGTSSSSTSSSSSAITLISTGTFVVDTSVSNTDLTSIKKGLQATITPTGSEDPVFGTVSSVGVVASSSSSTSTGTGSSSSSGSTTFPVTIAVTGKHTDLLPGSSATVSITTKQLNDVVSVPTQAITTVDGKTVVQKLVDGQQVQTEVTIGQVVGTSTVVTKGLEEGDEVVVASFTAANGTGTRNGNQSGYGGQGGFPGGQGGAGFPGGGQGGPPAGGGNAGGGQAGGNSGGGR